jgi:hypothetical protein
MKFSSFLIGIFISFNVLAFDYNFDCTQGRLKSFTSAPADDSMDCKNYLKLGFAKCFDSAKRNPDPKSPYMQISTPIDGYYSSKESSTYVKAKISEIIKIAVNSQTDPYMAVAIAMLEAPPTKERGAMENDLIGYGQFYGVLPIDAIGFADFLGCEAQAMSKTTGIRRLNAPKSKQPLIIDEGAPEISLCQMDIRTGNAPHVKTNCTTQYTDCCRPARMKVTSTKVCDSLPGEKLKQVLNASVGNYMQSRFQYAFKNKASHISDPAEKLAMAAQSYNGYGKYGVTEKTFQNKCLNRVDFSQTPIYGAGASDLMLNSVMANSEVREMVAAELKKAKQSSPVSYLCQAYGREGSHSISGFAFSDYSQKLLDGRPNCPAKTYALKGSGPRVPTTETTKAQSTD